jgi:hypothetical protein
LLTQKPRHFRLPLISNVVRLETPSYGETQLSSEQSGAQRDIERENLNSWDWEHAERYCRLYLDRSLYDFAETYADEAQAVTTAIVVTYSRPFSGNRDRQNRRDPVDTRYLDVLDESSRAIHGRTVELRNRVFAHSDASFHKVQIESPAHGELETVSEDRLIPLEKADVEVLLSNINIFKQENDRLLRHAEMRLLEIE